MIKPIKRILIVLIMAILLLTGSSHAFTIQMSTNNNEIKAGDEVVYTINLDENVVAANFNINYNSSSLELIGSSTNGLDVANKSGKIACIYADINGIGTNTFQIRFRARTTPGTVTFSISDAKFRGVNQDISYTNEDVIGLNSQTNISIVSNNSNLNTNTLNDNTVSQTRLPQTGVNNLIIISIIALSVIIAVIFKFKLNKIKNILPVITIIVMLGGLTYNTQAVTNNNLIINFSEINGNNIVKIVLPSDNTSITKQEIIQQNSTITSIKDNSQNEIGNTQTLRTGYIIESTNGTSSTIALLGDANKDGYVCDTDDLMVIINSYLGKLTPDNEATIAANVDDTNNVLDIQDISRMKDMYLGKQINVTIADNNNQETPNIPTTPDEPNNPNTPTTNPKILIAYFSHSGNTKIAADEIQSQVGGDLVEIRTVREYPNDYTQCTEVAKEEKDTNARPELAERINTDDYDIIFVGYPIWWHTAPMAVLTFLESNNLEGKIVVPFCTSAGSSIEESMNDVRNSSRNANIVKGITISGSSGNTNSGKREIENWLNEIGLK